MYNLRDIEYKRFEYGSKPYPKKASILILVYDIPYFPACGIFPPHHILNQLFLRGGGAGGMSPGASWEPFTVSETEYYRLVQAVMETDISKIRNMARYARLKYKFDNEFDHIKDLDDWYQAICNKHRIKWHEELPKLNKRKN